MQPFRKHEGVVVPLDRVNVDTDQIIPKQFLKRVQRTGFGEFLFYDWRYDESGSPNPDFELNLPQYANASILVTGRNFGCGSSREHAVWALGDYGIRVVIAPSFADIFHQNFLGNGFLPVTLPEGQVQTLIRLAMESAPLRVTVDLEAETITDGAGFAASFSIDPFYRHRLLNGLDDIALTLAHEPAIAAYEDASRATAAR